MSKTLQAAMVLGLFAMLTAWAVVRAGSNDGERSLPSVSEDRPNPGANRGNSVKPGVVPIGRENAREPASQDRPDKKLPDAKPDLEQSKFMRKKLEASGQILEGLTSENAELIAKGAKTLVEMSDAEKWQVKNNFAYRQFSGEFQRSAKNLLEAAEKKNFDAAALKWIDTTMKCLECHKYVRNILIAD